MRGEGREADAVKMFLTYCLPCLRLLYEMIIMGVALSELTNSSTVATDWISYMAHHEHAHDKMAMRRGSNLLQGIVEQLEDEVLLEWREGVGIERQDDRVGVLGLLLLVGRDEVGETGQVLGLRADPNRSAHISISPTMSEGKRQRESRAHK